MTADLLPTGSTGFTGATVAALERGLVRVFTLDNALADSIARTGALDALSRALGVAPLVAEDVQIIELPVIADLGLSGFLREGYEVSDAELAPHAAVLDGLSGTVALIRSGAFGKQAATLISPETGPETGIIAARLVATLHEPRPDAPRPFPAGFEASKGLIAPSASGGKKPSDAAMSGRVATIALVIMFAMLGLMIWVAS